MVATDWTGLCWMLEWNENKFYTLKPGNVKVRKKEEIREEMAKEEEETRVECFHA